MGRHSAPDQVPYYRSLVGWLTIWAVIAAATGIAVWVAVNALGSEETQPPARSVAAGSPTESSAESPTEEATTRVAGARVAASPSPTPTDAANANVRLITDGITVQVLNGTLEPDAADQMSARLNGLGFSVVSVEESSRAYADTTVFWSYPEAKRAAVALGERLGWMAAPKPGNLSNEVALHVVVGADES